MLRVPPAAALILMPPKLSIVLTGYVSPGTVSLSADRFLRPSTPDPRRSALHPKGRSPPPLAVEVGDAVPALAGCAQAKPG
jgi:hypothetical protein